jgi:hypothetical protein
VLSLQNISLVGWVQLVTTHLANPATLRANAHGFSLQAGVRCGAIIAKALRQAQDRHRTTVPLHHAPGDCQRTAECESRKRRGAQAQTCPELVEGTAWRNGTTHIVLTPMEFMRRVAALVPRLRLHRIRFHGVLAPSAKRRSQVVPKPAQKTTVGEGDCQHAHRQPVRMTWARRQVDLLEWT